MKVDKLKNEKLNHWTALADGYEFRGTADGARIYGVGNDTVRGCPDCVGDWAWCGPLIERFNLVLEAPDADHGDIGWYANVQFGKRDWRGFYGDTLKTAICRAVVASVYGEEIDDEM